MCWMAAARLFAASNPITGTLAETYLRSRDITQFGANGALRFHPKCWHREEGQTRSIPRPAMIAAVTTQQAAMKNIRFVLAKKLFWPLRACERVLFKHTLNQ